MQVFDKKGTLIADLDENKEIARGGEGRIIEIDANFVAKLYLPSIKPIEEKKFEELSELKSNTFVKPEKLLFDKTGNVVGFTMIKIPQDFFPLQSVFNKNFCQRLGISEAAKQNIIERVTDGLKFAHSKGVVIGDFNPFNILVNELGSVFFIDTDSYQTPSVKHSGLLLEDIRDYYYNGDVSVKSDFFALSVLLFNMLTFVHPFKGVSKQTPRLCDRMIKLESILNQQANVIIPKCYEAITDQFVLDQFERVFNKAERFIVAFQQKQQIKQAKAIQIQQVSSDNLIIHILLQAQIVSSYASKERLCILDSNGVLIIYDTSIKGICREINRLTNIDRKTKFYVYKDKVYKIENNILKDAVTDVIIMKFDNYKNIKASLYNNTLVIVTENVLYKVFLSEIYNNIIPFETVQVFGSSFYNYDAIHQNINGSTLLFYEKNGLNSSVLPRTIKGLYQQDNCGIIEFIENEKLQYNYFVIRNLKTELFPCNLNQIHRFDTLNDSILVIPDDNTLCFAKRDDMQIFASFECNDITANGTVIHCTNSGIIAVNEDRVFLINKK